MISSVRDCCGQRTRAAGRIAFISILNKGPKQMTLWDDFKVAVLIRPGFMSSHWTLAHTYQRVNNILLCSP